MKKLLLMSAIFLLSGCAYFDSNPPEGKTAGYVHEPSSLGRENTQTDEEEASSSSEEIESEVSESSAESESEVEVSEEDEDEVKTGMAIFRPELEQLIYLTRTEEETLTYSEGDIAYWNGLAIENGLAAFSGTTDLEFEQFVASVRLAIENAQAVESSVYEEPVYEEPVYEEPVEESSWEESSYEEESSWEQPSYSNEVPSTPGWDTNPDESGTEVPGGF